MKGSTNLCSKKNTEKCNFPNKLQKLADTKSKTKCKLYNSGFYRFNDTCKFTHFQTICNGNFCKDKKCQSRHPKLCRFKGNCKKKKMKRRQSEMLKKNLQKSDKNQNTI